MSIRTSSAPEIVLVDDSALFLRLLPSLSDLLHACVFTGASINFVHPFSLADAQAFWTQQLDDIVHSSGQQRLYAALEDRPDPAGLRVLGCVILKLAHQPNQQHRCDISKMLVHPDARRRGLGASLLDCAEAEAKRQGRWLLCLDTETNSAGEKLYLRKGYKPFGICAEYAQSTDGTTYCSATFMRKRLDIPTAPTPAAAEA